MDFLRRADFLRGYTCDRCGREVFCYPAQRLCERCENELEENGPRVCPKCGRQTVADGVCLNCKSYPPSFFVGCSAFVYDGEVAEMINALKEGKRRLAYLLGEKTAERLLFEHSELLKTAEWLVVPVPLTERAREKRGYNQAEELARIILSELQASGVKVSPAFDVLQKRRETTAQKHLEAKSRKENVSGAYHVHQRKVLRGKNVLLIDDIMTTGATGDECSRLLAGAGAQRVLFCTVAATPEIP